MDGNTDVKCGLIEMQAMPFQALPKIDGYSRKLPLCSPTIVNLYKPVLLRSPNS